MALVRRAFPGFDELAPVVDELLASAEGRAVRLADKDKRQAAALRLVRREAPDLDREHSRQVAARFRSHASASGCVVSSA